MHWFTLAAYRGSAICAREWAYAAQWKHSSGAVGGEVARGAHLGSHALHHTHAMGAASWCVPLRWLGARHRGQRGGSSSPARLFPLPSEGWPAMCSAGERMLEAASTTAP